MIFSLFILQSYWGIFTWSYSLLIGEFTYLFLTYLKDFFMFINTNVCVFVSGCLCLSEVRHFYKRKYDHLFLNMCGFYVTQRKTFPPPIVKIYIYSNTFTVQFFV